MGLAGLAVAGGNENHTVRRARTIDGGGRCVLEHFERHDVRRVDGGQRRAVTVGLAVDGNTGDYVERFVAVERVGTADGNRDTATGDAGVLCHLHAGRASLKGLVDRGDDGFLHIGVRYRYYGAGKVAAFHRTVAHNHHFVKGGEVLRHYHVHGGFVGCRFGSLEADIGENEGGTFGCLYGIFAVDVGKRYRFCPLYFNCCLYQWLPVGFGRYRAVYGDGGSRGRAHCQSGQQRDTYDQSCMAQAG